ncbi:MAG: leucyl/phenylalanyl-tRNA--protein transferase [Bacteroidales bacterium]|nr:leucyl/phenylalanyl-tRNA--protein transferase [Bacteroidales bacterium]
MPVFQLDDRIIFPDPQFAEPDGLLAIGGDLSVERLLAAYKAGIFPWFSEGTPILWWSPNPRMVLFPEEFKRYKSLRRIVEKGMFRVTFDQEFKQVMTHCGAVPRKGQDGTWITDTMIEAYFTLYKMGYAHSVEVWQDENLVGGLYGVLINKVFFGESMFHLVTDASKVALWHWVDYLTQKGIELIDVQQETNHLRHMGARLISRESFITLLRKLLV